MNHPTRLSSQAPPDKAAKRSVDISFGAEQQKLVDAHFQSYAARWREVYTEASSEGAIYRERSLAVLKWVDELTMPRVNRVLEIGCGAGLIAVALARRGYLVEAVDSVADMLSSTRRCAAGAGMGSSVVASRETRTISRLRAAPSARPGHRRAAVPHSPQGPGRNGSRPQARRIPAGDRG